MALWYSPVGEVGGVARHVLDAARSGIPGWRLVVVCPEGWLADELREAGAAVVTGPVSPADGARTAFVFLRGLLTRLRPCVLHTHLAFADIAGATAAQGVRTARGGRIRVVSTEHGIAGVRGYYQEGAAQAFVKASAHRARLARTDAVIAVSESTREQILDQWGLPARLMPAITVVRNGVDAPAEPAAPQPGLRVLSLSRLAAEKRIDLLLAAFARVVVEHPEARLTIAGDGPDRSALEAQARGLGLESRVTFPGVLDPDRALRDHDVVAQLSDWENLSYTLLDAVAYGRGVVATDVGGNSEIVPSRCLVFAQDADAVARTLITQGLQREQRPQGMVSTVAQMCAEIAEVYRGIAQ